MNPGFAQKDGFLDSELAFPGTLGLHCLGGWMKHKKPFGLPRSLSSHHYNEYIHEIFLSSVFQWEVKWGGKVTHLWRKGL